MSNGNIASCSEDKTIRIWDAKNNYNNIHILKGHDYPEESIIELSNGNIVSLTKLTPCDFPTIKIWDAKNSFNNINTFNYLEKKFNSNIKLSDGCFMTCSDEGEIRIFNSNYF